MTEEKEVPEEDKVPEEKKEEPATPEVADTKTPDLIGDANLAASRLEAANKEHRTLLAKQESMMVEKTLGGKADASVKVEETPEAYAARILAGDL